MKLQKPVSYKEKPEYPSTDEVKVYTETYRLDYMDRVNPDKGYHDFEHTRSIEVKVIGGMRDYFVVYAYPPAGFEVAKPEDILQLELWQGWILEWLYNEKVYRVDTTTREHGVIEFKRRKSDLGY
ncbi:hypothetical protein ES702_06580 [subsurface metagenome]